MTFNTITRTLSTLSLCALLTPAVFAGAPVEDKIAIQRQGLGLIRDVETVAGDVQMYADRLNTYSRSFQISRGLHANDLHMIRSLVNDQLRPALVKLEAIQPQLPEWKQQSINKMLEAARALAADANNAIMVKREALTVPPAMNAEYKAFVSKVHEHASALVKMSDAAERYVAARLKAADAGIPIPTE